MQKFALIISVAVGFLSVSSVRAEDTELTVYNRGEGNPYFVQLRVTQKDTIKTSKEIAFNDSDSVLFNKADFVRADVYKTLANTVGDDGKTVISSESITLAPGAEEYCYAVTGTFAEAKIGAIPCPNKTN